MAEEEKGINQSHKARPEGGAEKKEQEQKAGGTKASAKPKAGNRRKKKPNKAQAKAQPDKQAEIKEAAKPAEETKPAEDLKAADAASASGTAKTDRPKAAKRRKKKGSAAQPKAKKRPKKKAAKSETEALQKPLEEEKPAEMLKPVEEARPQETAEKAKKAKTKKAGKTSAKAGAGKGAKKAEPEEPSEKRIIVASKNPAKTKAVELGFSRMFPETDFRYEGVSVASGVGAQPMSDDETFAGALQRAYTARQKVPDGDFWVGLEGGIEEVGDELFAFAWMVIIGQDELMGKSRTATFVLPPAVSELVREGKELGEVDDIVFGKTDSKESIGAVGILTHGLVDRAHYYSEAVLMALIPFKNTQLYQLEEELL